MAADQKQQQAPVAFDPWDPTNIKAANFKDMLPVDVMTILNQNIDELDYTKYSDDEINEGLKQLFMGTAKTMVVLRQRHLKALVRRSAMFAHNDASTWARPNIGLKRTFPPRFMQPISED
ncbi:small capsid protein [Equid alphaherpesvirus 4]|uniref:Small capsomere-interacting protein n=2 Tax=Equid alphaherpesvirus 4 TaxID=10331 RepID=A0A288CG07_EHV4|nr:small capsid protein [Equid alphaherpesvirus 4]AAC59540.1 25 [Equid alphaherpesvirus 4]AMB15909.1 small capsid protein [Equid alphaherpesvirus 4]AMB15988.1 small capsid protein [Equid alphaherpesvirus 4]AMB16067.1 small capsid protein [Equid alphaherpesvirus 4]AMB16146.1 small capsid protein [Equid alphaherpesvirus 4]